MIVIKKFEDIAVIKNDRHREALEWFFKGVMVDMYKHASPEDCGWTVYFEEGDDLFGINLEANFQSEEHKGIYFDQGEYGTGWEDVSTYEGMWNVLVLMNNEFGMNYFIPDEDWVDPILIDTLKDHLSGEIEMEDFKKNVD